MAFGWVGMVVEQSDILPGSNSFQAPKPRFAKALLISICVLLELAKIASTCGTWADMMALIF